MPMFGALYIIILILTWILSALFAISGVGAANTLIPIYYSFGIPFSIAAAAGLLLNVFSLSSATANNAKHNFIIWKIGVIFLIPAVIMAPVGAMVGVHTPRKYLLIIFVIFLSYTLFNLIRGRKSDRKNAVLTGINGAITGIFIGALAGFLGGLLGVGGGMIILPVLTFMETDYKKIAGTSAFIALFSSASGFMSYLAILRGVNYILWIIVLVGGVAGGLTGSLMMHRFDSRKVRLLIIVIILFVTLKTAYTVALSFR
ncbi:sulfite exporter TauE/SafE family protein [Thermoplasma sp. Kam2015]|nr:sulfite exporter TauE/SafE family protein [Thermoplasma sp. Kam2015]